MTEGIATERKVRFTNPRDIVGHTSFPIWIWEKEVKLKGEMTGGQLISVMKKADIEIGDSARHMLQDAEYVVSSETRIVHLACCEIGDLGFSRSVKTPKLWAKLKQTNSLCPQDAGPHLRCQFMEQPIGEWALVAMNPISMNLRSRGIFFLGCNKNSNGKSRKLWIQGLAVGENGEWNPKIKIIVAC
ncbi:MAG: hypothetical protein Q8O94_03785 [bacterium]|nr:hypothetical protein [bacterium]